MRISTTPHFSDTQIFGITGVDYKDNLNFNVTSEDNYIKYLLRPVHTI